ncbi:uncharacterized protein LOC124204973 [Daphnia pulex]|uniref:uncharacterized protein LOC124204973 n=1 Tax=Daphnia pulex TaxID=6669 RepID=UPI001EDDE369|nr:uncharacterized protein LOC124204973 [Daphnia pulex]
MEESMSNRRMETDTTNSAHCANKVVFEYYEFQDLIDAKDPFTSSWVEAKIVRITKNKDDNQLEYQVLFQGHEREIPLPRTFKQMRPRAEDYNMEENKNQKKD